MSPVVQDVLQLARLSLMAPQEAARKLLTLTIPRQLLWQMMALVVVLSVLLAWVNLALTPSNLEVVGADILGPSPFSFVLLVAGSMIIMVFGVWLIGRLFGGSGRFDDVLLLVIWLQALMLLLQIVQSVLILVLPGLAGIAGLLSLGLLAWLLTNFTAVAHGFSSLGRVFVMIIAVFFGISLGFSLILVMLGIEIAGSI